MDTSVQQAELHSDMNFNHETKPDCICQVAWSAGDSGGGVAFGSGPKGTSRGHTGQAGRAGELEKVAAGNLRGVIMDGPAGSGCRSRQAPRSPREK